MILLYALVAALGLSFTFLPQFIAIFGLTLIDPNDPVSRLLRVLINIRFLIISKFQNIFIGPKYVGKVEQIYVFPLKSVSYITPTKWTIGEHGLKHDRQYMLAFWDDAAKLYQPYTLRNSPGLARVKIDYNIEENWFKFTYPVDDEYNDYDSFKLPMEMSQEFIKTNSVSDEALKSDMWGVKFETINIGKAIPQKFFKSMHLDRPGTTLLASLGKKVRTAHPQGHLKEMKETLFQDYYPMHLLSTKAVDELNSRVRASGSERQVTPLQFRPNIVVGDEQVDMDYWFDIRIKGKQLFIVQKTIRCTIGNVILGKGGFDKTSIVTRTLRDYRRIDPGKAEGSFLGDYAIHKEWGYDIEVGDEISLVQQRISSYEILT